MKQVFTLSFFLIAIGLFAQPANDNCPGIIDLGVAPFCPDDVYFTNVDATPTDIGTDNIPGNPDCAGLGAMERDVWFSFIASDTIEDYTIMVIGESDGMGSTAMLQPQVAVYRGDCEVDGLELLECNAAAIGESMVSLDLSMLDAGLPYFIRITDYSQTAAENWGTFKLCVKKKDPVVILDDDVVTNLCSGEMFDSGGPDGDYSSGENYTFTIQPTPPVGCITFSFTYYNIDNSGDIINFFDGPSTASPSISTITGGNFSDEGGGAVCYTVVANSGALTMQFISDGSVELEGFQGVWECSQQACETLDLVQISPTPDDLTIIDNISTPLTTVTITDLNCSPNAYGTFEGDNTNLGLEKGIVLTSGNVGGIMNPGTFFTSASNGFPGDPDLDVISTGSNSNDACILELDVFVATDELTFEYVFGSEEYPEFVNTTFNDIFAFLISGPGIVGDPGLNGQKNIAILPPPASTPVEINSVNNLLNWEYYRNNADGPSVAYDGLTSDFLGVKKSLTARSEVIPCNTYHLKLAVADRGDFIYDSGVFISELQGGTPTLDVVYNNGIDYLVEECLENPDEIVIGLSSEQDEPVTYDVLITGTATPGVDYTLNLPAQITFLPGQTEFTFPITALFDGVPEGLETIEITLSNDFGCGTVMFETLVIEIFDELQVEIFTGEDTAYVCLGSDIQMLATGAFTYIWAPGGVFDNPNISNPIAEPAISQNVFVVGMLGVCSDIDTIFLEVVDPMINIGTSDPTGICVGDSVTLGAQNNVGNSGLFWTANPPGSIQDPTVSPITVAPTVPTTYTVNVELEGCGAVDEIFIDVDPFDLPELTTTDTTICENYSVTLAENIVGVSTTYQWTPEDFLDPGGNISGPVATPEVSTVYTLIATSQNAYCADTVSINIEVLPANVEIIEPGVDTLEICLGESVDLTALTTTPGMGLNWTPDDGSLSSTTDENTIATPTVSTLYLATLEVGACLVFDSIYIRVDSLPEGAISELIPDKETYCEGELITIVSPTYEPANFPDIMHQWIPDLGLETPDTLWNLVIQAVESATYQRITTNRACADTVEVFIEVIPTASIQVVPDQATICVGDSIQLNVVTNDPIDEYTWSFGQFLSCDDCPNPIAFPSTNTVFEVEGEFMGCPVNASANISVVVPPSVEFPTNPSICPGSSIVLNNAEVDPNASYTWTVNGEVVSEEGQPEVSPTETTTYDLIINLDGCIVEGSITVVVIDDTPELTLSPDAIICLGDDITLTAEVNFPGLLIWEPGGQSGNSITVSPDSSTSYTVSYTSSDGCIMLSESVTVDVSPGFSIDSLTALPNNAFEGTDVVLTAFTNPPELQDPGYVWTLNGETVGTTNPATVIAPSVDEDSTQVTYSVTITDAIGCSETASVTISVNDSEFVIPNLFTPNGDATNPTFNVLIKGNIEVLEFKVFNRWGQMVYDNDTPSLGWNGTYKGKAVPSDVYAYMVVLKRGDGSEVMLNGEVTLLR